MRVLIHGINYSPELTGVGKYTGQKGSWLAANGHEVRVVTAPPYYPTWKVSEGYSGWRYSREEIDGASVWRCPLYVPKKRSGPRRILHLMSFAISSLPVMMGQIFWRPDVVVVIAPTMMNSPTAFFVAWLSRAKSWVHVADFEVEAALDLDMFSKKSILAKLALASEGWLLRRSHFVSTISNKMLERLLEKGVHESNVANIRDWANIKPMATVNDQGNWRKELNIGDTETLLLYAGNMGEKQGLEIVLEVAEQLESFKQIHFIMAGDGAARVGLEALTNEKQLKNVRFLPLQPNDRFAELLASADIHLVIQKAAAADLVLPSKTTNIMAAGKPMIVTTKIETELGNLIEEFNVGVRVEPESVEELKNGILDLANDASKRMVMGANARRYAETYLNKENILRKFEKCLLNLIGCGNEAQPELQE